MTRGRNKATLFDYGTIQAQEELPPTLHCLSATTKMLLLSVLDPIGWTTRYIGDADKATVERWRTNAMTELILDSCGESLCELIAWAIENCEDVQGVLDVFAGQQGWSGETGNPTTVLPVSVLAKNMLPSGYVCDDDHRYGMAVGLADFIHGATIEFLELVEVATNPLELVAEIGDNVPILELAATAADVILWIQETQYEAYVAAWSDPVRDELACQIYCQMALTGSCLVSLDTLWNVYNDNDFANPPSLGDPLIDWLLWLFALPLTTSLLIVKITSLLPLLVLRYGGKFGLIALGIRSLETTIELLSDDTNEDWDILCSTCPEVHTAIIPFRETNGGFEQLESTSGILMGEWSIGVGWEGSLSNEAGGYLHFGSLLKLEFATPAKIGQLTLNYSLTKGYTVNPDNPAIWENRSPQNNHQPLTSDLEDGDEQDELTNDTYYTGVTRLIIGLRSAWYPPPDPPPAGHGKSEIHSLTILIEGDVPEELLPYIV